MKYSKKSWHYKLNTTVGSSWDVARCEGKCEYWRLTLKNTIIGVLGVIFGVLILAF